MAVVHKIRQVQLVGRKIRSLRKQHNLTQSDLASRVGIQQSDLSRMEKGEYRVSLDTLFRMLAEFGVGMGEFFEEVARDGMTPRQVRFLSEFSELDEQSQREVEDFVMFKRAQRMGPSGAEDN
jgi:transcriptional regulator with XRE-family HTH domain